MKHGRRRRILKASILDEFEIERFSVKDYLERSVDLIKPDGGPPRWFSPIECNSSGGGVRFEDSPLLLYLPGLDGVGLGLIMHHQRLGKMFDVWCLHIPVMDRTPFEATSFNKSPMQPILPLLEVIPEQLHAGLPYFLGFVTGDPFKMAMALVEKGLPLQQAVGELSESVVAMLPSLS
ncbi:hypothetical protein MKX03_000638, partial [Papaver bracteatum]